MVICLLRLASPCTITTLLSLRNFPHLVRSQHFSPSGRYTRITTCVLPCFQRLHTVTLQNVARFPSRFGSYFPGERLIRSAEHITQIYEDHDTTVPSSGAFRSPLSFKSRACFLASQQDEICRNEESCDQRSGIQLLALTSHFFTESAFDTLIAVSPKESGLISAFSSPRPYFC